MASLGPLVWDLSEGYNEDVSWGCSHPNTQLGQEPFPSSLIWLLAELSSLWVAGQKPPSVPCHVGLSVGQLTTWQLASLDQVN